MISIVIVQPSMVDLLALHDIDVESRIWIAVSFTYGNKGTHLVLRRASHVDFLNLQR